MFLIISYMYLKKNNALSNNIFLNITIFVRKICKDEKYFIRIFIEKGLMTYNLKFKKWAFQLSCIISR